STIFITIFGCFAPPTNIHAKTGPMTGMIKSILVYLLVLVAVIGIIDFVSVAWERRHTAAGPYSASPKITGISRDFVYDLSGSEAGGLGNAIRLFDEHSDPKTDPSSVPYPQPLPVKDPNKFFPPGRDCR